MDAVETFPVGDPVRILVVDDFRPFRESICSLFLRYEALTIVGEAEDGQEAIEMTDRLAPQIILMDVKMPRMGGVEATRRIKNAFPDIHIIAISAHEDTFLKASMRAVGSSIYVTKDRAHTLPDVIATITGRPIMSHYHFGGTS